MLPNTTTEDNLRPWSGDNVHRPEERKQITNQDFYLLVSPPRRTAEKEDGHRAYCQQSGNELRIKKDTDESVEAFFNSYISL